MYPYKSIEQKPRSVDLTTFLGFIFSIIDWNQTLYYGAVPL